MKPSARAAAAIVVAMVALAVAATAHAGLLFSDNFNAENGGASTTNYSGFAKWTVSNGSVDLCQGSGTGDCVVSIAVSDGLFLDMDGTLPTPDAGKLTSNTTFSLVPGLTYTLSFDLAGNQRFDQVDSITVAVGTAYSETFTIPYLQAFTTYTKTFSVTASTVASISFDHAGGDNVGILLDNVSFSVPAPPGLALLAAALVLGVFAPGRRRFGPR
jgi:hypothetical protein